MLALYNLVLPVLIAAAKIAAAFNPKLRRGLSGRSNLLQEVREHYAKQIGSQRILIHVASFGELEQAKPVIAELRKRHTHCHIHLTFFSPSGYENVIDKYKDADLITYSPFDQASNVHAFLDIVKPDLALFARYDVWPNMALELERRNVPSLLFAATAADTSGRMLPLMRALNRQVYNALSKILVISDSDKNRLTSSGIKAEKISVAGDTRFDQVIARREASTSELLPERIRLSIEANSTLVFVLGSAWQPDEKVIEATMKQSIARGDQILWIIAPHEPREEHVSNLKRMFSRSIKFSNIENWSDEAVIIVDSIGKLFTLYKYADIAMIGGGFSAGLHNALEAAVWSAPVIVGPNHQKSLEVQQMIDALATFEVKSSNEFDFVFWRLVNDEELRRSTAAKAERFVAEGKGATERIMLEIEARLL
jgi:3-deoxy-D-manno-octulosonic-acid transferase